MSVLLPAYHDIYILALRCKRLVLSSICGYLDFLLKTQLTQPDVFLPLLWPPNISNGQHINLPSCMQRNSPTVDMCSMFGFPYKIYRERPTFPQTAIFDISQLCNQNMSWKDDVLLPLSCLWNYRSRLRWFFDSLPTKHVFPETMSVLSLAHYEHVYSRQRLAFSQISNLNILFFCSKFDWNKLCPLFSSGS